MTVISHRGNLTGVEPLLENSTAYVEQAIKAGYVVEVDLRYHSDHPGGLYLGHDLANHKITEFWLVTYGHRLLLHVKDVRVLIRFPNLWERYHCFCHSTDSFTITSRGLVWYHDLTLPYTSHAILPLMTMDQIKQQLVKNVWGICTDFPRECDNSLEKCSKFLSGLDGI